MSWTLVKRKKNENKSIRFDGEHSSKTYCLLFSFLIILGAGNRVNDSLSFRLRSKRSHVSVGKRKSIIKSVVGQIQSFRLLFFAFLAFSHIRLCCVCIGEFMWSCEKQRSTHNAIPYMNMNLISGGMLLFKNVCWRTRSEMNTRSRFDIYTRWYRSLHSPSNEIKVKKRMRKE